jgi:hypothetical protein
MCKDGDVLSLLVLISREASSLSSQQRVRVPVGSFPLQGIQLSCSLHFQPPTRFGTGPGEHTRAPRAQNATGRAGIRRRLIHPYERPVRAKYAGRAAPVRFPVVIGEGSHPFPFRTRKLSLLPPMVLHG